MRAASRTWASVPADAHGIETIFYVGGRMLRMEGRRLVLPVADDLANVGQKTLACFEHVLEHRSFDLVFRTNCSSYVDLPNLEAYASAHARPTRFYAGDVITHGSTRFASGSGYFLSRDLLEQVVRRRAAWDHSVLDDVALGALLAREGVAPETAPRRDYRSRGEVRDVDLSQFHFRCRTDSWGRIDDARIMIALHRAFCRSRGVPLSFDVRAVAALEQLARRARAIVRRS